MPTSRDVARVAGVSQATVSRVLHKSPRVSPETRQRVLDALAQTGYAPNGMARAMRTRRNHSVGVVVSRITNPFYPEVIETLSEELDAFDQKMILWNSEGAGEVSAIEAIRQRLVDGVIFTTATQQSRAVREALSWNGPIVLMNRGLEGAPCDQVMSDNETGGKRVAEYLTGFDHERIALIGGPSQASTAVERERGFCDGLAAVGLDLPPEFSLHGDFSHEHGARAMTRLLELPEPPTAVFCVNDLTAFGALDAARARSVRVPNDLWVVGYDDIRMASWAAFDLTTVRQPIPDMVRLSVNLLLDRIENPSRVPQLHQFPSHLIVRGSTANTVPSPLDKSLATSTPEHRGIR